MITRRWLVAIGCTAALALLGAMALEPGPRTSANTLGGMSAVTAGGLHTCALTTANGVMCWGDNTDGQLGDGTTMQRLKPVAVSGLPSGVAAIAAGSNHTCALLTTGGVKCWGYNRYGQLGNGTATGATEPNPTPVDVSGLQSGVVAIAAGGAHTCALLDTGGVKCWGWNRRGQIGDGQDCSMSQCRRLVPTDVTGLSGSVVAIAAGVYHNCALLSTGGVKCWGQNDAGQLGAATGSPCVDELLNPIACAQTPVDVTGLSGVARVAAGGSHSCALLSSGHIDCWGDNSSGQLGDGGACGTTCGSATEVSAITTANAIATGERHTCAIIGDAHVVYCWGENGAGQVGNGDSPNDSLSPIDVCAFSDCGIGIVCTPGVPCRALRDTAAIAAGTNHNCALMNGGNLKCWGDNSSGQLGDSQGCGAACDTPVSVLQVKGALPDLVVTSMSVELESGNSCVTDSPALGIRVGLANTGSADAGTFVVDVNGIQQTYAGGLAAGASGTMWFQGSPPVGKDLVAVVAIVDSANVIAESNESNNTLTETLPVPTPPVTCTPTPIGVPTVTPTPSAAQPGDANCDGNVNSIDAALVLQYGAGLIASLACQTGADVNHSGSVDAIDAALILQYVAALIGSL